MIYKHDLIEQREAIQEDLRTILDAIGFLEAEYLDRVCDMVVERFHILINKTDA